MQRQKVSLDERLDNVNYEELARFKPSVNTLNFFNFVKIINFGNNDYTPSPPMHYKMIDDILKGYGKEKPPQGDKFVNMFHRGAGKTTVGAELLILYLAAWGHEALGIDRNIGIIYVADSMENGAKNLSKNIEARYENSEYLKEVIPKAEFLNTSIELKNRHGYYVNVKLYGAKTGVRGVKMKTMRPCIAIIDDIMTDEDSRSDTSLDKINDSIYKAVLPALLPDPKWRRVIWNGTPFNKRDPLYSAAESGAWVLNVYPVCEKFPCPEKEFRGSWENRFSYDEVKSQYQMAVATGNEAAFYQEYMLRIASLDAMLVKPEDLRWYNREDLLANKNKYNFYITTDLAVSDRTSADNTVIGVWAVDADRNRYLVDGVCAKQDSVATMNDLFTFVKKYLPREVGMERSGQQLGIIQLYYEEALKRNLPFTLSVGVGGDYRHPGIKPQGDKFSRFSKTLPNFKLGKVYFPKEKRHTTLIQECIEELHLVTQDGIKSKYDDCIDMISQLDFMNIIYPDPDTEEDNSRRWEQELYKGSTRSQGPFELYNQYHDDNEVDTALREFLVE